MTEVVPQGWYPDPHDPSRLRYWDGASWTSNWDSNQGTDAASSPWASPARATHLSSADDFQSAINVVGRSFWRILGLGAAYLGIAMVISFVGSLVLSALVADSGQINCTVDRFGNQTCDPENVFVVIFAVLVGSLIYGATTLGSLWVFAAIVRIVRGEQTQVHVRVGVALAQTWSRAWRFLLLALVVVLVLGLLFGLVAVAAGESITLGVLFGLALVAVSIAALVALTGLYAWVLSPTSSESP